MTDKPVSFRPSFPSVASSGGSPGRAAGLLRQGAALAPGLLLCCGVAALALGGGAAESRLFGKAWLEPLVLAILIGMALRSALPLSPRFHQGTGWSAKILLEVAVALMGAAMSVQALEGVGVPLLATIVLLVFASIGMGFLIGRLLGLPPRMAVLLACGNSICGNSAIAAVAPAIDAEGDDVAAAIAFTAVLGVGVVLALPLVAGALHLAPVAGGALAGLTVYAVPQVLAAAAPLGPVAIQFGTLVKLVRVLMLGPVVVLMSLLFGAAGDAADDDAARETGGRTGAGRGADRAHGAEARSVADASGACGAGVRATRARRRHHGLGHFLPWFILAFLTLCALRSLDWLPALLVRPAGDAAGVLTVVAMAGLGLGVDVRSVRDAGPRVALAVTLSLLFLAGAALLGLHVAGIA